MHFSHNAERLRAAKAGKFRSHTIGFCCLLLATAYSTIAPTTKLRTSIPTNAKVDTLALTDKATTPYGDHIKDIEVVQLELAKAAEYDNGRPLTIKLDALDKAKGDEQDFQKEMDSLKTLLKRS